jgi:outer membrane immunogenic protein
MAAKGWWFSVQEICSESPAMWRSSVLALALAVALFGAMRARAADAERAPPAPVSRFDWSGLYAGFNGGYAWGRTHWSDPASGFTSGDFDASGGLLGGQLGYNWQSGNLVLGFETDLDWTSLSGSTAGAGTPCVAYAGGQCTTQQDWLGTTRGRIGYAFDRWLPYLTGGLAYGDIGIAQPAGGSSKQTKTGWTVGAGLEYSLNRNWSAKVEYLHLDLGTASFFSAASQTPSLKIPLTDDVVRAGISYHW